MSPEIWISIGSNQGNRKAFLDFGLKCLAEMGLICRLSNIYETEAWGRTNQSNFLNLVCSLVTAIENPLSFLSQLKKIEVMAGRIFGERWSPRTLDLDLLFWGSRILTTQLLTIPHPRIALRKFVLVPLAEIAPLLLHPRTGLSVQQMLALCPDKSRLCKWGKPHFY